MEVISSLLLDIIIVTLFVLLLVYSIKKGFSGSMGGVIFALLAIGIAGALGYLIYACGFYDKIGWQAGLEESFGRMIGEKNAIIKDPQTIAKYIAMAIFILIGFIISYALIRVLFFLLGKPVKKCRDLKGFAVFDSVLGVLVNVGIYCAIILCTFAFIHAFKGSNHFVNANEFLDATYLSRLIYRNNPLNSVFDGLNLVSFFDKTF